MNSHAPHEVLGAARWLSPMGAHRLRLRRFARDPGAAEAVVTTRLMVLDALLVGAVAIAVLVVAAGMVTP